MANNTITFSIKVGDDGTFDIITKKAKGASKATGDLGKSTDNLKKKRNDYSKQEKGVAGATSNSTKAFAKQAQTIGSGSGGLVAVYAVLMANVFALSQAFGILNRAAGVNQLIEGLQVTGEIGGRNLERVARGLREISGGAISAADAMKNVALGTSAGFSTEQMEGLARVATGASKALGRDLTDAMDRLTRGAAKLEPEIVDELGIMVRLDKTTKDFAKSVGKTEEEVTQFEKRMAFTNAIIEQGTKKFGDLIDEVEDNPFNQLAATFTDLAHSIATVINTAIKPLVSFLAGSPGALLGVLSLIGAKIFSSVTPALSEMRTSMVDNAKASALHAQQSAKTFSNLTGLSKESKKLKKNFKSGTATLDQHAEALTTVEGKLKNNIGFHKEGSKAQRENGRDMTAVNGRIKNQIQAHKELRDSLVGSITAQGQARQAQASAHFENGKFIEGLKELKTAHVEGHQSYKQGTKGVSRFGKIAIFARIQSTLLAGSLKSLGLAFLSIIPFLGIILAGIQLLFGGFKAIYSFFMGANPIKDAMKENKETIESLDKISDRYTSTIGEMTSEAERFARTAHTMAGSMDQIIEGINGIAEAEANRDKNPGLISKGLDFITLGATKKSREENLSGDAQSATSDFIEQSSAPLRDMMDAVKGDTAAKAVFQKMLDDLNKLTQAETVTQFNAQKQVIKANQLALQQYNERLTAATKSQSDFTFEIEKMKKKAVTPYDALNDELEKQSKLLKDAAESDRQLNTGKSQELTVAGQILGLDKSATEEQLKQFKSKRATFQINRDTLAITKEAVKLEKTKLDELKGFEGKATEIFALQLRQEDILLDTQLKALEAEEDLIRADKELVDGNERLKQLKLDMKAIDEKRKSGEERRLLVLQSQTQELVKFNNALAKTSRLTTQLTEAEFAGTNIGTNKRVAKKQKSGQLVRSQQAEFDKLKTLRDFEKERTDNREAMLELEKEGIDLEFTLLKLKGQLLLEELKVKKMDTQNLETHLKVLDRQQIEAKAVATQRSKNEGNQGALNILNAENAFSSGIHNKVSAGSGNVTDLIGNMQVRTDTQTTVPNSEIDPNTGKVMQGNKTTIHKGAGPLEIPPEALDTFGEKMSLATGMVRTFANQFKELGPEGEIIGGAFDNIASGMDQMSAGFEMINEKGATTKEKVAGAFSAAAGAIGAVMGLQSAQAALKVRGIDKEIAAEKKRDGQSAKSIAKMKELEKKKEQIERKAFAMKKKMMIAQAIMSTAAGVAMALTAGPIIGPILAVMTGAMGLAQIAIIRKMEFDGGGGEAASAPPSQINVGSRQNKVDLANANNASGELGYMRGASGTGNATNFKPAFTGARYRADGGRVGYMVGEQGPELFMPDSAGEIVSAGETDEAMQGAPSNVTFNINTIDASGVAEVLTAQRSNIIGMIRESANNVGEPFLEGVT